MISSASESSIQAAVAQISNKKTKFELACQDLSLGMQKWPIWLMLGYQDIKLRYRRSILGPFWITLSMAITVYSMGFLYSHLFHNDVSSYFPFLTAGMLAWALISTAIMELTEGFTNCDNLIKQIKLPYSLYIHRMVWKNILIFLHNLIVILPILVIFHQSAKVNFYSLALLPNLALVYVNAFFYGLILAMIGARYRDLSQMVKSLVQVVFFLTPVLWNPSLLPERYQLWIAVNPFYAFVELLRAPMIGQPVPLIEYAIALGVTLLGILISLLMFSKYRSRIVYWL